MLGVPFDVGMSILAFRAIASGKIESQGENMKSSIFMLLLGLSVVGNALGADNKQAGRVPQSMPSVRCNTCDQDPPSGGTGSASPKKVVSHQLVSEAGLDTIAFDNGAKFRIDYAANRATYTNELGQATVFMLSDLVSKYANGDAGKAQQMTSALATTFGNAGFVADYAKTANGGSGLRATTGRATNGLMMNGSSGPHYSCYYYYECYSYQFIASDWGGYGGSFSLGGYSLHYVRDYIDWQNWHNDQCDAANSAFAEAGFGTAAMAVGCATAATGVGAVGCGIGALYVIYSMNKAADATKNCSRAYTGPGNY